MSELGLDDLVASAADAWRWRNAATELCGWHRRHYDLLRLALGIDVDVVFGDLPPGPSRASWELARGLIVDATEVPDPFGRFLEAPEAVIAVYQRHKDELNEHRNGLTMALRRAAADAIAAEAPDAATRTTTTAALIAAGLPGTPPDPVDFW
jgi:hypothetical protein